MNKTYKYTLTSGEKKEVSFDVGVHKIAVTNASGKEGGGGAVYTAGDHIEISQQNVISADISPAFEAMAEEFDPSKQYKAGDLVTANEKIYKFTNDCDLYPFFKIESGNSLQTTWGQPWDNNHLHWIKIENDTDKDIYVTTAGYEYDFPIMCCVYIRDTSYTGTVTYSEMRLDSQSFMEEVDYTATLTFNNGGTYMYCNQTIQNPVTDYSNPVYTIRGRWFKSSQSVSQDIANDCNATFANPPSVPPSNLTEETIIAENLGKIYTAGSNIIINGNEISAIDTTYSAGANISISDGVISAEYVAGDGLNTATDQQGRTILINTLVPVYNINAVSELATVSYYDGVSTDSYRLFEQYFEIDITNLTAGITAGTDIKDLQICECMIGCTASFDGSTYNFKIPANQDKIFIDGAQTQYITISPSRVEVITDQNNSTRILIDRETNTAGVTYTKAYVRVKYLLPQ